MGGYRDARCLGRALSGKQPPMGWLYPPGAGRYGPAINAGYASAFWSR